MGSDSIANDNTLTVILLTHFLAKYRRKEREDHVIKICAISCEGCIMQAELGRMPLPLQNASDSLQLFQPVLLIENSRY